MNLTLARVRAALVILTGLACGPVPAAALDRAPPAQNLGAGSTVFGGLLCAAGKTCDVSGMSVTALGVANATPTALSTLFSDAGRSALFGIKCDGASGTDNTAAINAMLAAVADAALPPGVCRVTGRLTIPSGRTLRGNGAVATKLAIRPDFNMSASGIVKLGGVGSRLLDLGVSFEQPDTGSRAALTTYPVAIDALGSGGGWTVDRVRVGRATKVLDMRGEQGQSRIGTLEASFFTLGVDIDGATDSFNIGTMRFWTYEFTANNYQVLLDGNTTINGGLGMIGLNAGRMDGLIIDSFFSMFYPKAMRFYYSAGYNGDTFRNGITTAAINKLQLDTQGTLFCEYCDLSIAGAYMNVGYPDNTALVLQGGSINIGQLGFSQFTANLGGTVTYPATEQALFQVSNLRNEAKLTISGFVADQGAFDRSLLSVSYVNNAFNLPRVQISGVGLTKDPTKAYTKPVFDLSGAAGNILGVSINNLSPGNGSTVPAGSGTLFNVPNDNPLTITSSATVGWTNVGPTASAARYNLNSGWSSGGISLPLGGVFAGSNITTASALVGAAGLFTGNVASPTRRIDAAGNASLNNVGFNGATPVGKCTLPAALATDGSATNAALAAAINALRSCGLTTGLAQ